MAAPLLLVDWGTSNRRAWLIDEAGRRIGALADDRGLAAVAPDGWEAAYRELLDRFGGVRPRLAVLAGMVGSNRGWAEAAYVDCPADLGVLARHPQWIVPGEIAIVPGLCQRAPADVMRGEEVQALGAVEAGLVPGDALACHPGTHSKWVRLEAGRIAGFRTQITGELHGLLRRHSLLAEFLDAAVDVDEAFRAGIEQGFAGDGLTAALFGVRARILLGQSRRSEAPGHVSGLLIGAELRDGLARADGKETIHVIGRDDLARLYVAALAHLGREAAIVDGEEAALAGLMALAERLA